MNDDFIDDERNIGGYSLQRQVTAVHNSSTIVVVNWTVFDYAVSTITTAVKPRT